MVIELKEGRQAAAMLVIPCGEEKHTHLYRLCKGGTRQSFISIWLGVQTVTMIACNILS